jgi:hypothetical protein
MIEKLRVRLKDDVWDLINNNEKKELDDSFFLIIVMSILLERESFNFEEVKCLAKKLKKIYDNALKRTSDLIIEDYGDVIKILKDVFGKFDKETKKIMIKLNP